MELSGKNEFAVVSVFYRTSRPSELVVAGNQSFREGRNVIKLILN